MGIGPLLLRVFSSFRNRGLLECGHSCLQAAWVGWGSSVVGLRARAQCSGL